MHPVTIDAATKGTVRHSMDASGRLWVEWWYKENNKSPITIVLSECADIINWQDGKQMSFEEFIRLQYSLP